MASDDATEPNTRKDLELSDGLNDGLALGNKQEDFMPSTGYPIEYSLWAINTLTKEHEFDLGLFSIDFYCNFCKQSLPIGTSRIRCAECADYDLCINCACRGENIDSHDPSHKYIPIGPNTFCLFSEGWSADEELLLLEGVSKYGFGNWKQVSEMVNGVATKQKTPCDCETHYNDIYISSDCSPYPDVNKLCVSLSANSKQKLVKFAKPLIDEYKNDEKDACEAKIISSEERGCHSDYIPPPCNMLNFTGEKLKIFQSFNGYNIYRDELENEYVNDAELIIKDVEFEPWDTPAEVDFKMQLLDIYNGFLDERIRRKRIVLHRFWNDYQLREKEMQNMTEVEKLVYWRTVPLLRFHKEEDHVRMSRLIVAKAELEKRLKVVGQWCSLGLETIEDVQHFDSMRPNTKQTQAKSDECFDKLSQVTKELLTQGQIKESVLNDYVEEISTKFCREFSISKSQLDQMLDQVSQADICESETFYGNDGLVPTWDICFYGDKISPERNTLPNIVNIPEIGELGDCSLRLILRDDRDKYDLSDLSFEQMDLQKEEQPWGVQQSHVRMGKDSLYYLTRFCNKIKVQKDINKRKRDITPNIMQKRNVLQRKL